jgi:hypothetical protein
MKATGLRGVRLRAALLTSALGLSGTLPVVSEEPARSLFDALPVEVSPAAVVQRGKLLARPTTLRARVAGVDRTALEGQRVAMQLFSDTALTADFEDIGFTGTRFRSWTGRLPGGGSAVFIINGDRVSGTVSCPAGNFSLYPAGGGQCVVVQHQPGAFPDCAAGYLTAPAPAPGSRAVEKQDVPANGDTESSVDGDPSGDASAGDTPTANRVRVLVAYTADAQSLTSSVQGQTMLELIDLAVLESNQGYANSGVTLRMELACLYETVFNESSAIENDVDLFRNNGDGFMDEVHTLRADYDADMCCLIVDGTDSDWCGWAYGFDYTSYANMFQATSFSCATGDFTFAHEFGHTQGCRHNDDNALTPFAYGHGFRNDDNWRTIMGLANGTGAPRLNYWSNPNINSPVSPFTAMGTPVNGGNFANDCRAALNVSDDTVVDHEATPASSVAPSGDTFDSDEAVDKLVTGVLTVGTFTANSGSRVQFRGGTSIALTPGFWARTGSDFRARLAGPLGDPAPNGDEPAGDGDIQEP